MAAIPRRARVGTLEVAGGTVLMLLGAAIWLGFTIANTGGAGLAALGANASFLGLLLVATAATRSVRTRFVLRMVLLGGFMMTISILWSELSELLVDIDSAARNVVEPLAEETLKLGAVAFVVWRWRRGRAWALGASDLLVIGAAVGAGFALVEDAYIREAFGWGATFPLLPTTEYVVNAFGDRFIVGHAIWATLSAGVLGLSLLLIGMNARGAVIGLAGYAVSFLDHMANNLTNDGRAGFLHDLMLGGRLDLLLFAGVAAACVIVDLRIASSALPKDEALSNPAGGTDPKALAGRFAFARDRRGLAYAAFRYDRATPERRTAPHDVLVAVTRSLVTRRTGPGPAPLMGPALPPPPDGSGG